MMAMKFAKDLHQGMVLQLKQFESQSNPYLDVSWMSDFPHENERLFAYSYAMRIEDILTHGRSHKIFMQALSLFQQMMNGNFFFDCELRNVTEKVAQYKQNVIMAFMVNYTAMATRLQAQEMDSGSECATNVSPQLKAIMDDVPS